MLSDLLQARVVVRLPVMRATVHLVSADDCPLLRPAMQPVLDAELSRHPQYAPSLREVDLRPILEFARAALEEEPRTMRTLRTLLAEQFPGEDAAALAYACRNHLPLVQLPPRGLWGRSAQVTLTTAEAWLGRPLARTLGLEEIAVRYLAAFGPASVADFSAWCRLTGLRAVVERLRPQRRTFRDENGRELFDLPDAPRPDPATPAPVRFLPEYDNVPLSHADRSRFHVSRGSFSLVTGRVHGTVLSDGVGSGVWRLERDPKAGRATLVVQTFVRLSKRASASVEAEGRRLLRFLASEAEQREVRLVSLV